MPTEWAPAGRKGACGYPLVLTESGAYHRAVTDVVPRFSRRPEIRP